MKIQHKEAWLFSYLTSMSLKCHAHLLKLLHVLGVPISPQNQPFIKGWGRKGKGTDWPFLTKKAGLVMRFQ